MLDVSVGKSVGTCGEYLIFDKRQPTAMRRDLLPARYRLPRMMREIEAAWASEIQPRVAAYERGELKTYAAEDVFAEARQIAK